MMRAMGSPRQGSESLNAQLLVDSIPALIHTSRPDGYLDYFNKPWLEYLGVTLDKVAGWNWTAYIHPDDVDGIVSKWRASLATGEIFEYETRVRCANGEYRWMFHRKVPLRDANGNIVKWYGSSLDIEERKIAEQKIREQEAELRSLLDLMPQQVFVFGPDGNPIYANRGAFEYFGVGADRLLAESRINFVHPDDRKYFLAERNKKLLTEAPHEFEARLLRHDGIFRWFLFRRNPLKDERGHILRWYGTGTDIDDRKRAEEALRTSEAYLGEAQRLSHTGSFGWRSNNGEIIWSDETYRIFEYDRSVKPTIDSVVQRVHPEDRAGFEEVINRALAGATDFEHAYRLLLPHGQVKHVHALAHVLADAFGNREFVGAVTDITERKTSEEKVRRLVEAGILGIFFATVEGGIVEANQAFLQMLQYDRQDLVAGRLRWEDLTPAEWRERDERSMAEFLTTGVFQAYEKEYFRKDGSRVPVLVGGARIQSPNEGVVFVLDLSEQKRAEAKIRRSESYLAEAQKLSQTGSWAWSPDDDIRYWSEECYRVLSFDSQDGLPRFEDFVQRIHPDDQPGFRELIETVIREKAEWEADYRIVHPRGAIRDIHVVGHPVLSTSGHLVEFVGTVIDVTERKRAEEERRRSEAELRQILDLAPQHVAVYGASRERLYANHASLDYRGVSLDEWRQRRGISDDVHPDDVERLITAADRASSSGSALELELRVQAADGSYRWFLSRFSPVYDDNGQITRWYVACTDIEDRKQAEDRLRSENVALREELDKASMFEEIVGTSPALKSVLSRISKVAPSDSTVLITGETGTGKELVARAIHRRSDRASRAFVSVNCAAIPRDLIASELFGHEKGAFTGATQQRLGRFELANGGTLFLDEVGELPAETQIALLRVLQEHEFERVGGTRRIRTDVRVIAATNRDLQASISGGSFRSDLFYRLNVFPIEIPSLGERQQDIPLLVEYFIDRYARKAGKKIKRVNKKTLELLQSYPWPGNIRELQNVIERSMILCETEIFSVDENWLSQAPPLTAESKKPVELPRRLLVQEKDMIEAALKDTRGRVSGPTGAAAKLGIPRSTLESKIRSHRINKNRFRPIPGA
jgi:formate hydrogenlyase transcriptional activator